MDHLTQFGEAGIALTGLLSWLFGHNPDLEDQEFIDAHNLVHDAVVNGDMTFHGISDSHKLRDQLTPAQFQALQDEFELRSQSNRN